MGRLHRRRFLQAAAVGGAAAVAGGPIALARNPDAPAGSKRNDPSCPGADPDWSVPPSTLPSDPADCPIEHIGVLMMENRTYDTYFGWLENGRGFLNLGMELTYQDPDDPSFTASPNHWAPEYRRCGHPDPDHSWNGGRDQLQRGFLAGRNDEYALAYYLAEDIPTYARLARQFTVFDRYFCSVLGPTFPNRFYQHSGQAGGLKHNALPNETGDWTGFPWPTIWDRLEAGGISWTYYYSDLPATAVWGPRLAAHTRPIQQFYADARAGTLPHVYFVDPAVLTEFRVDDHPGGADMRAAQAFVNNVVHSVVTGPQWSRSAFFVNYDEWGGFFDHVTPPRVPDDRENPDNLAEDHGQLGFRVPAIAISPYSRKGYVHHEGPYEHTSILRFIEWRWDLEPLTLRTASARNIGECFDYDQAPRTQVGIRQMETPTVFASTDCDTGPPAADDFTGFALSGVVEGAEMQVLTPSWTDLFGAPPTTVPPLVPAPTIPSILDR